MPVLPRWAPVQRRATVRRTAEPRQTVALAPSGCTPSICRAETAAARYHALKSGVKCEECGRGSRPQPAGSLREHGRDRWYFLLDRGDSRFTLAAREKGGGPVANDRTPRGG